MDLLKQLESKMQALVLQRNQLKEELDALKASGSSADQRQASDQGPFQSLRHDALALFGGRFQSRTTRRTMKVSGRPS